MVDGCVRVLSTYREAVAETGPCGGVYLGLRLVQLNKNGELLGRSFFSWSWSLASVVERLFG